MKIQKILINGTSMTIEELLAHFTEDEEIDFDALGACLDSEVLDRAIDSFTKAYGMYELIERYLELADKPIEVTT